MSPESPKMFLLALDYLSKETQVLKMLEGVETVSAEHLTKGHQCGGTKFCHRLSGCSISVMIPVCHFSFER